MNIKSLKRMNMTKIILEVDKCIGCGFCEAVCPQYWELKGEKTTLKGSKKVGKNYELDVKDAGCSQEAANGCPAQCIKIRK
jgi:ferredoxin